MGDPTNLLDPVHVLYRIKRGLAGYLSYLAACDMNESFSEYILYEPILRILTAQEYHVKCEVVCPGIQHQPNGDKKKIDFVANKNDSQFAIEVKWARKRTINVNNDIKKLSAYKNYVHNARSFFCVFGTENNISNIVINPNSILIERGNPVIAKFGVTRYGCRIYELAEQGV